MNKVFEIGRLTRNPEVRYTTSGKAVCTFTIAVDDGFGENKKAYFFPVVIWGKGAEVCGNSLTKGSKVAVVGKLTTRSYENKDGKKIYVTEIVADGYDGVQFLDAKKPQNNGEEVEGYNGMDDQEIPF